MLSSGAGAYRPAAELAYTAGHQTYATARQWWLEAHRRVDWAQLPVDTVFEGERLGR
ncbi:hypothetical protein [Streptomyces kaniharaensis]|uniref:hypothetical protein n=1 Tax=Streptomyces kaniharaensis TaxID=212423 RepID=UPI001296B3FA|nr:hypothetical protein [Streptomyces kaniharaensis]